MCVPALLCSYLPASAVRLPKGSPPPACSLARSHSSHTRPHHLLPAACPPPPQLLGGLLEVNLAFVRDVEVLGLAPLFFDFLSLEHSNNNVHNIRLCRQLIAAGSLTVEQIMEMQVRLVTCQDCLLKILCCGCSGCHCRA